MASFMSWGTADGQGITDHHRGKEGYGLRSVPMSSLGLGGCPWPQGEADPLLLSPGAGAPPYLGGPVAMNQDGEGVVDQVPSSNVAHFKLQHDLIWG